MPTNIVAEQRICAKIIRSTPATWEPDFLVSGDAAFHADPAGQTERIDDSTAVLTVSIPDALILSETDQTITVEAFNA